MAGEFAGYILVSSQDTFYSYCSAQTENRNGKRQSRYVSYKEGSHSTDASLQQDKQAVRYAVLCMEGVSADSAPCYKEYRTTDSKSIQPCSTASFGVWLSFL